MMSSPKKHYFASTQANFPYRQCLDIFSTQFEGPLVLMYFQCPQGGYLTVISYKVARVLLLKINCCIFGMFFFLVRTSRSPLAGSICDCNTITHFSEDCCLDRAYWCVGSGIRTYVYGYPGFPRRGIAGSVGVGLFIMVSFDWYNFVR